MDYGIVIGDHRRRDMAQCVYAFAFGLPLAIRDSPNKGERRSAMKKEKEIDVKEILSQEESLEDIRARRRKEYKNYMERYPKPLENGERYRDGKRRFYGDLLFSLMGMHEDEEDFGKFCEKILMEDDEALQYNFYNLEQSLKKVKDSKLAADIMNTAYGILDLSSNFYIALGAFIGQSYTIADRNAQQEIDDIGKRMIEENVFPLIAKQARSEGEAPAPTKVIPVEIKEREKITQEKRKPVPEKGFLTVEAAAARLGVSKTWVYRKCQCRIMPHVQIGGVRRIPEKDLQDWLNGHKIKGCLKV